jgi:hypothetical protein
VACRDERAPRADCAAHVGESSVRSPCKLRASQHGMCRTTSSTSAACHVVSCNPTPVMRRSAHLHLPCITTARTCAHGHTAYSMHRPRSSQMQMECNVLVEHATCQTTHLGIARVLAYTTQVCRFDQRADGAEFEPLYRKFEACGGKLGALGSLQRRRERDRDFGCIAAGR